MIMGIWGTQPPQCNPASDKLPASLRDYEPPWSLNKASYQNLIVWGTGVTLGGECALRFPWDDVPLKLKGWIPSRKLPYPTWGKGKSSSNMPYQGDMLVPWRVPQNLLIWSWKYLTSTSIIWRAAIFAPARDDQISMLFPLASKQKHLSGEQNPPVWQFHQEILVGS